MRLRAAPEAPAPTRPRRAGRRRRIGVVIETTSRIPLGGSEAVGFWTVAALQDDYEVAIIAPERLSVDGVNAFFGTRIRQDVEVVVAPMPRWVRAWPRLRLLAKHYLSRYCKRAADAFDLVISASSEMDLGRPGIQYVHFPLALARPRGPVRAACHALGSRVSGHSQRTMAANWTLANSRWTAERTRAAYGIEAQVVYPPVADGVPDVPWEAREDGFVCLGRISPEKNLEGVIRILREVRRAFPRVHLHVVGEAHHPAYRRRLEAIVAAERGWVFMEGRRPRRELLRLVASHRYGIHGVREEHFGIGIAEMAKAGCLVFVPRGGGQVEIVGADDLAYDGEPDAVARIRRVLADPLRQASLRAALAERTRTFSAERFMREMRDVVARFLAAREQEGARPEEAARA